MTSAKCSPCDTDQRLSGKFCTKMLASPLKTGFKVLAPIQNLFAKHEYFALFTGRCCVQRNMRGATCSSRHAEQFTFWEFWAKMLASPLKTGLKVLALIICSLSYVRSLFSFLCAFSLLANFDNLSTEIFAAKTANKQLSTTDLLLSWPIDNWTTFICVAYVHCSHKGIATTFYLWRLILL